MDERENEGIVGLACGKDGAGQQSGSVNCPPPIWRVQEFTPPAGGVSLSGQVNVTAGTLRLTISLNGTVRLDKTYAAGPVVKEEDRRVEGGNGNWTITAQRTSPAFRGTYMLTMVCVPQES